MILALNTSQITENLYKQLSSFFDISEEERELIDRLLPTVLERCRICFKETENKYYSKNGNTYFSPYHSGQYTIFLYIFSKIVFEGKPGYLLLADKLYYLNKIMNGCDLFYEIKLPNIFFLDHPVGSVLGRAQYGEYFKFAQNCTVGNNKGIFPVIGKHVEMFGNSMIIGNSKIGDNVKIGAGACVKDENIESHSIVFGESPNLIIKKRLVYT